MRAHGIRGYPTRSWAARPIRHRLGSGDYFATASVPLRDDLPCRLSNREALNLNAEPLVVFRLAAKENVPTPGHAVLRYQRRKDAIDAVARGEPATAVARVMGVPLRTMFQWLAQHRHGGYHALREGQRSGRPRKVTGEVMQWLYQAITLGNPLRHQFTFCLWTLAIIGTMLKREKGIELSKSGVSRLLGHLGLSPQRPIYRSYKQNPKELDRYLKRTFPKLQ